MNRRNIAGLVVVSVVVSSGVGWVAGSQIRSPAEVAASTAAPEPSPILVPTESRVLSTDVITRGTARFGSPQQLAISTSALKANIGVMAGLPLPGSELAEGDIILRASNRPVFLMVGDQPVFRDLGPGLKGDDVRQLEEGLVRLGFDPGPADGVYDDLTGAAVAAWYQSEGFDPFETTEAQLAAIRAMEKELLSARLDILSARDLIASMENAAASAQAAQVSAAAFNGGNAAVAAARAAADAANKVAAAEVAAKQAMVNALAGVTPVTATEVAVAKADVDVAKANAASVKVAGQTAVASAQAELDALMADPNSSPADLASAQAALDAAKAAAQAADNVAAAEVAAKEAALQLVLAGTAAATPAEIAAAKADLATAQANAETVRLSGEKLVAEAVATSTASSAGLTAADTGVRTGQTALSLANQTLSLRRAFANLVEMDLGVARRRAGVQVPADEIVFVKAAPVRVSELAAARGDQLAGAIMTVTDAVVVIDGSLPLEAARLVQEGMVVLIDEPNLGIKATGVVTRVALTPGTNGVDGFHVYFESLVDGSPPSVVGASVRLTIPIETTGDEVLVVPLSALSLAADGTSRVQRNINGVLEYVTVEPGLSADGYVGVTPVGGSLQPGDLVLIGYDQPGPVAGG